MSFFMDIIDKCIEIRSNLVNMMSRHEARVKADEEVEKARKEAEWQKRREEREAREAEWKKSHPNLAKYSYCSSDENYSPYYGGYCKIHFYEWSDLHATPKTFDYCSAFYKFLDECKLFITESQNAKMRPLSKCFITCKPGCKELLIGKDYDELVEEYNKCVSSGV